MSKGLNIINELESMVKSGTAKKTIGENTIYSVENGKVIQMRADNCVTYETISKGNIVFK